jgi:dTMP kinase
MADEGTFIVFEGIDGSGTTTQLALYARHLRGLKRPVHTTCEPSDGPVGALLRVALGGRVQIASSKQAQTMALLFAADRLDHLAHDIEPHLRDGLVVLCDRYDLSSVAYQTATAPFEASAAKEFEEWVRSLNRFARRPTVTLVIDVDPDEAERRRRERRGALELYEETELQRRLAALYRRADELMPRDRIVVVDGNADRDAVADRIREALAPFLG